AAAPPSRPIVGPDVPPHFRPAKQTLWHSPSRWRAAPRRQIRGRSAERRSSCNPPSELEESADRLATAQSKAAARWASRGTMHPSRRADFLFVDASLLQAG